MQYVALLDCNNFFVSCERLFRPDLANRPVVVLSGNDGCVVARSNEVKTLGVPMGIPYFQVKEELQQAKVEIFSSNFTLYRDISARVMRVLKTEVSALEVYSVDEAFFALEAVNDDAAGQAAFAVKQSIEQQVGIPVSVGVAATKTVAKYASETAKQAAKQRKGNGVAVLQGEQWQLLQAEVPLQKIWGIGARMSGTMRGHGLHTVADLLATERSTIARIFGVGGARIYDELHEQSVPHIGNRAQSSQKSYMSTRSFSKNTTSLSVVSDAVAYHVAQVAKDMRRDGVACRHLMVSAAPSRHGDWVLQSGSAELQLDVPTSDPRVLIGVARRLLESFFDTSVPYKKAGVVLSNLVADDRVQPDLFTSAETRTSEEVVTVLDELNARFGRDTVTVGRTRAYQPWQSKTEWLSPQYTTKWSDITSVKA